MKLTISFDAKEYTYPRWDTAGAGAGGVFRAKLITIMESPETDKKFAGLTEDTRGPSLVPL